VHHALTGAAVVHAVAAPQLAEYDDSIKLVVSHHRPEDFVNFLTIFNHLKFKI
jgi:hypothetical protein